MFIISNPRSTWPRNPILQMEKLELSMTGPVSDTKIAEPRFVPVSREIKRGLLLGRKAILNLDSILKSRDITLPTKIRIVKAKVFPVVMYRCESWTIQKAEH